MVFYKGSDEEYYYGDFYGEEYEDFYDEADEEALAEALAEADGEEYGGVTLGADLMSRLFGFARFRELESMLADVKTGDVLEGRKAELVGSYAQMYDAVKFLVVATSAEEFVEQVLEEHGVSNKEFVKKYFNWRCYLEELEAKREIVMVPINVGCLTSREVFLKPIREG